MTLPIHRATAVDLLSALAEYVEAKTEHDYARNKYHAGGGYSWGYFGARESEALSNAAAKFEAALNGIIDARAALIVRQLIKGE